MASLIATPGTRPDDSGSSGWRARTRPGDIAFALLLVSVLATALALRLLNITNPPGFDEGKYSQGLTNMSRGFRPFADIFNPQGPLFYPVLFPFFKLGGETLEAARLGSITLSMVGLIAVGWAALLAAGRAGAVVALVLLTVSPQYLAQSRVIQSEGAALGFALPSVTLALAGFLTAKRSPRHALILFAAASVALALSFAVKALTLGTAAFLGLAILLAVGLTMSDRLVALGIAGALGLAVLVLASLPFGIAQVWEQGVVYHAALKSMQGPDLSVNWTRVSRETAEEGWGLLLTAALGTLVWAKGRPRIALVLVGWLLVTFGVLMTHSPLLNHHMVVLVPIFTLLSVGLVHARRTLGPIGIPVMIIGAVGYLAALSHPIAHIRGTVSEHPPHQLVIDAGKQVATVLRSDEFFITDHPYAATLARRATPPELADADKYRFESGWITSEDLIRISQERNVKAALLWLGVYTGQAKGYVEWLQEHYFPLWSSEQPGQVLYVRKDIGTIDVAQLPGFTATPRAVFGADLELLGYSYPLQALPGTNVDIRLIWHAKEQPRGDYRVFAVVTDDQSDTNPNAKVLVQSEGSPLVGAPGPATGSWVRGDIGGARIRLTIPTEAPLGRTHLYLGLSYPDGSQADTAATEPDGKPRRNWRGLMFLSDFHIVARS